MGTHQALLSLLFRFLRHVSQEITKRRKSHSHDIQQASRNSSSMLSLRHKITTANLGVICSCFIPHGSTSQSETAGRNRKMQEKKGRKYGKNARARARLRPRRAALRGQERKKGRQGRSTGIISLTTSRDVASLVQFGEFSTVARWIVRRRPLAGASMAFD